MPKKEAPLHYLQQFVPYPAIPKVMEYLHHYKVHLTITKERKTVLGDYRHATLSEAHRISVNGNLNRYAFLVTLIHELAHLVAFTRYGRKIQAHGKEWKAVYAGLLKDFIMLEVFPADIVNAFNRSIHDLPASGCSDENLMRTLRKYDEKKTGLVLVEQVPEGTTFDIGSGRLFKKGKKLRKRYACTELKTGKIYLFSPIYEVRQITA
jgi:SprT protein